MQYIPDEILQTNINTKKLYEAIDTNSDLNKNSLKEQKIPIRLSASNNIPSIEIDYSIIKIGSTYFCDPVNDTLTSFYGLPSAHHVFNALNQNTKKIELFLQDGDELVIPIACIKSYRYDSFLTTNRRTWATYTLSRIDQDDKIHLNEKLHGLNINKGRYSHFSYLQSYVCRSEKRVHILSNPDYEATTEANNLARSLSPNHGKTTTLTLIESILKQCHPSIPDTDQTLRMRDYLLFIIKSFLSYIRVLRKFDHEEMFKLFLLTTFLIPFIVFFFNPSLLPASLIALTPAYIRHVDLFVNIVVSLSIFISSYVSALTFPLPNKVNEVDDWKTLSNELNLKSYRTDEYLRNMLDLSNDLSNKDDDTTSELRSKMIALLQDDLKDNTAINPLPLGAMFICPISQSVLQKPVVYIGETEIPNIEKNTLYEESYLAALIKEYPHKADEELYTSNSFASDVLQSYKEYINLKSNDSASSDIKDFVKQFKENGPQSISFINPQKSHDLQPNTFRALLHPSAYHCYPTLGL